MLVNSILNFQTDNQLTKNTVNFNNQLKSSRKYSYVFDEFENFNKNEIGVTFTDGLKCVLNGFKDGIADSFKIIKKHPIKTSVSVGLSSLALMLLPIIGIPTSVAAGALSIIWAINSVKNTLKHTYSFVKNKKNNDYTSLRNDLNNIGKDTIDLAISLPFVPKGIKDIKRFTKYGKLAVNKDIIVKIAAAPDLKSKLHYFKNIDRRIQESINFNEATNNQLLKIPNISERDKTAIERYIKQYNVPRENIPDVALKHWAKEHNVSTLPDWTYTTLNKSVSGSAQPKYVKININNYKNPYYGNGNNIDKNWIEINRRTNNDVHEITYKHKGTGTIKNELLNVDIENESIKIGEFRKQLSPQAREVSTVYHEREHIDQFARFYSLRDKLSDIKFTQRAQTLYEKMLAEMPQITQRREAEYIRMYRYKNTGTRASYLMNPKEIEARKAQLKLHERLDFQTLDAVFKQFNEMKVYKNISAVISNILINIGILTKVADSNN